MKTSAIFAVTAVFAAGCSSPAAPSSSAQGGAGGGSAGAGGAATGSAGTAGGTAVAGSSGNPSGGAPSGGAPSGGASGSAGSPSAGGTVGVAGAAGTPAGGSGIGGGSAGSGGSVPVGDLPNLVPAGYTGKPFGGTPQQIPGKIEVERYDTGGNGVAFNAMQGTAFNACGFMRTDAVALECTGQPGPQDEDFATCANYPAGSVYIGYIGGGNYYKYTVDVLEAGTYVISGHEGVSPTNTSVTFAFTADIKTGNIALPSTNGKCTSEAYHVWGEQQNLGEIALTPGHYVMTLTVVNAGLNMDWFAFTKQ